MTLREAILIKNYFDFEKVTVTKAVSGNSEVYQYFFAEINGVKLYLDNLHMQPDIWVGTIENAGIKFFTVASFKSLIRSIQMGEWHD